MSVPVPSGCSRLEGGLASTAIVLPDRETDPEMSQTQPRYGCQQGPRMQIEGVTRDKSRVPNFI